MTINPVFLREMLLLRKKLLRLGYVFSSLLFPMIYLVAFGWGLGSRVQLDGTTYAEFLLPGLVAMTSMTNAFNLTASSLGMGRLFFRSTQVMVLSPLSPTTMVNGYLLAGMVRGLLAAAAVAVAGILLLQTFPFTAFSLLGLLFNLVIFAAAGLVVGIMVKDLEDLAVITNFVIMPMAFFSGTFFPLDGLPPLLGKLLAVLPLSQVNTLMRAANFDQAVLVAVVALALLLIVLYLAAWRLLAGYQE